MRIVTAVSGRSHPRTGPRALLTLISSLAAAVSITTARAQYYPIPADAVYGQPTFTSVNPYVPMDQRIYKGSGLAPTPEGLYVSDAHYNRVLFFPEGSATATRVYGQPDFNQYSANNGGVSASSLNSPSRIAADASGLYVADYNNHRVLRFPPGSTTADRVYGQPNFTSNTSNNGGLSASSLRYPNGVALEAGGGVYISDYGNNRVLYYPPGETTATFVYGQQGFTTSRSGWGAEGIDQPGGIATDGNGLYVAEWFSNRARYFPKGSKTATRVYGQPDFYSTMPNAFGMGPRGLMRPVDCAADENGLYVSEYLNSRVVFFPNGSTAASVVYGQPDFNTLGLNQYGVSRYGFYVTQRVAVSADKVYVADFVNRVLRFPKVLTPMAADVAFSTTPASESAGEVFSTQPVVVVRRSDGSPAVDFNGTVLLRIKPGDGPECGKLLGRTTVYAVNGVATFTDVSINEPGTYRLQALALSLPVGTSEAVFVGPGPGDVLTGDLNRDNAFNMADITLHLRAIGGLEAMP